MQQINLTPNSALTTAACRRAKGEAWGEFSGSLSCGQPSPSFITEEHFLTNGTLDSRRHQILKSGIRGNYTYFASPLQTGSRYPSEHSLSTSVSATSSLNIAIAPNPQTRKEIKKQFNNSSFSTSTAVVSSPVYRKIQAMYGSNVPQKRFPSDITLNTSFQNEGPRLNTTIKKPGTVKIQVRSRSAQASPCVSPAPSPVQIYRFGSIARSDIHSQPVKPINTKGIKPKSSSADGPQSEDDESQLLPSVREIIRQVEEMTQKNCQQSSKSSSKFMRSFDSQSDHGQPKYLSGHYPRPTGWNNSSYQNGFSTIRSCSASGGFSQIPRLRQPPVTMSRPNNEAASRKFVNLNTEQTANRKTDVPNTLPHDYQKLKEAFFEQRREIQRLRKLILDKESRIIELERDIRLYEPWRKNNLA